MRRLLYFLIFSTALLLGWFVTTSGHLRDVYQSICELTSDHFYRQDQRLESWVRLCSQRAARLPSFGRVEDMMSDLQDLMAEMKVSHFQIYTPVEDARVWRGEGIDTGIRARFVEDHLVVYRVVKGEAGDKAGVRVGDEIMRIEGTEQVTPWGASRRAGWFDLRRKAEALRVRLEPVDVTADLSPRLTRLSSSVALLELPSFRSEYFEKESWRRIASQLRGLSHVVVDVRENAGGNFVAMLRALSTFHCAGYNVGRILQPRKKLPKKPAIDDNTEDGYQIEELDKFGEVGLVTFADYGCYRGRVTVLISDETASTAEIFADSFLHRSGSRVWGLPSAGDVVLAVWYSLPSLGPGYSVSIPEAVYVSRQGRELEGKGVWPQRELQYDLKQAFEGRDSWVTEAIR